MSAKSPAKRKKKSRKGRISRRAKKEIETREAFAEWKQGKTPNGKMIADMMKAHKVNGNFKDYVVIAGSRLIDYKRAFSITVEDGKTLGVQGIALVHKRRLKNVIGDEAAAPFWHPTFGRAVDVPQATQPNKDEN